VRLRAAGLVLLFKEINIRFTIHSIRLPG
jgi:hypothetical protein